MKATSCRTRSYRRHMFATKLERRIKMFASWNWLGGNNTHSFRKEVMRGRCSWIRTTGRPCNCYSCTMKKYKRLLKSELKKLFTN